MVGESLRQARIQDFLAALGSPSPTPGGGSAAAAICAVGAALVEMTARVSADRRDAGDRRPELLSIAERCRGLRDDAMELADQDAEAYRAVSEAYRLPKATEADRQARTAELQRALIVATDVPFEIAERCIQVARLAVRAVEIGSASIAGDAGVGAHAVAAALRGVLLNADQNLAAMQDQVYVATGQERSRRLKDEVGQLLAAAVERLRERGFDA